MNDIGLGERLAAIRTTAKLSQEEMSQRLGMSRSAYQNYERGQRDLPSSTLFKIYKEFDIDPLWILEGDSNSRASKRQEEFMLAYRKIGVAVERRIAERRLSITSEKKWDALDFLFGEFAKSDLLLVGDSEVDTQKIDSVLRLVA